MTEALGMPTPSVEYGLLSPMLIVLGVAAIPLVLLARAASVIGPLTVMRPFLTLGPLALPTLIWGGLRGGISVALALGLPDGPARSIALAATYIVVLFSVIVQGGSIARLLAWLARRDATGRQADSSMP